MTPTADREVSSTGMVQRTIEGRTYQMLGKPGEEKETAKMLVKWVEEKAGDRADSLVDQGQVGVADLAPREARSRRISRAYQKRGRESATKDQVRAAQ